MWHEFDLLPMSIVCRTVQRLKMCNYLLGNPDLPGVFYIKFNPLNLFLSSSSNKFESNRSMSYQTYKQRNMQTDKQTLTLFIYKDLKLLELKKGRFNLRIWVSRLLL